MGSLNAELRPEYGIKFEHQGYMLQGLGVHDLVVVLQLPSAWPKVPIQGPSLLNALNEVCKELASTDNTDYIPPDLGDWSLYDIIDLIRSSESTNHTSEDWNARLRLTEHHHNETRLSEQKLLKFTCNQLQKELSMYASYERSLTRKINRIIEFNLKSILPDYNMKHGVDDLIKSGQRYASYYSQGE